MKHMLIVSCDQTLASALTDEALQYGWQSTVTTEAPQTMRALYELQPGAVVLDVDRGHDSGPWLIYSRIREVCEVPILVFARDGTPDVRVSALRKGADDAVSETCTPAELMMRVRNLARHHEPGLAPLGNAYDDGVLCYDAVRRLLTVDGTSVGLTPGESKLLLRFLREPERFLTIEELTTALWGEKIVERSNVVKVYIHRLRRKIRSCSPQRSYITNHRAIGYRLR